MSDKLQFDLVSPERKLASISADEVVIPGVDGEMAARPGHSPVMTTLRAGFVAVQEGDRAHGYFVSGGFAEVSPEAVTILAEEAEEHADVTRASIDNYIARIEDLILVANEQERAKLDVKLMELRNLHAVLDD